MNQYEQQLLDSCALYPHHHGMMISVVEDWYFCRHDDCYKVNLHTLNHGVLHKKLSSRYKNKLKNSGVMTFSHLAILRKFISENSHHRNGSLWRQIQYCVEGQNISIFEQEKEKLQHFFTFEAGQYKTFSQSVTVPDVMIFSKLLKIFKKRVFGDYIGGISASSSEEGKPSNFSAKF